MALDTVSSGLGDLNLQDGNNYLNTLANKYVVKPKNAKGIGGFLFDYEGETNVTYQAEITDHWIETNDPVQDHIAQKPVRLMLRGFIGELVLKQPAGLVGALATLQSKLTTVPAYIGKYTPGTIALLQRGVTTAQNTVNTIDQGLQRVKNIVGLFPGAAPQKSKQQQAFSQLTALYLSRQVFTVQTPYTSFDSMVIETLTFIQPEETKYWSDISVTMKQLRFVDTQVSSTKAAFGGRAAKQREAQVSQGNTKGTPQSASILYQIGAGLLK